MEHHKNGKFKGKPILNTMTAKEHLHHLNKNYLEIQPNGCHKLNVGHTAGYPCVGHKDKTLKVTRLLCAVELDCEVSDLNPKTQHYGHTCGNKYCVNPDHGRVVTPKQNAYDGDKGKTNPVPVKASKYQGEIRYFESIQAALESDIAANSFLSRALPGKAMRDGGNYWANGFNWTRISVEEYRKATNSPDYQIY